MDLAEAKLKGIAAIAAPRTLSGVVTASSRAVKVEYDTAPGPINLTGESIIPGAWGSFRGMPRGGYLPVMLSHNLAFGYHIYGESRRYAENLMVPLSHIAVNGTVIYDHNQ